MPGIKKSKRANKISWSGNGIETTRIYSSPTGRQHRRCLRVGRNKGEDVMTAKEYLSRIRLLTARLELIDANIKTIREERLTLRPSWPDGQPHGTQTGDPTSQKVIELAALLEEYEREQIELRSQIWRERIHIVETIGKVEDSDCQKLLFLRYVNMLTWEQIAVWMGYTYQWVAGPLHGKALSLVAEIINKKIIN